MELDTARVTQDYTLPELVDPTGVVWQELDGTTEILPGITLMPTPGHTDGHQSLVVRHEDGSVLVVSGQSHDTSAGFAADALAVRARRDQHGSPLPVPPAWMDTILSWDPARVVFAHDSSVWEP